MDAQMRLDLRRTAPASRPTTHASRPLRQLGSSGEPEAKTLGSRLWHEQRTQSGQRVSNEMRARGEAMRARERGQGGGAPWTNPLVGGQPARARAVAHGGGGERRDALCALLRREGAANGQ
jgi:hypothetical protein